MNITKISKCLINYRSIQHLRSIKTDSTKVESLTDTELIENAVLTVEEEEDNLLREQEIERKRNKSRLNTQHRNMLHEIKPYDEPQSWIHETVKYQRTMLGRYGLNSGVHPGICWPTKQDILEAEEFERISHPHSIPEMVKILNERKEAEKLAQQKRQEDIAKKVLKIDQWKKELNDKIAKREADALNAKLRKDRLVEEVRRHFGFTIDPRDERFKEMLEKKEKEEKKMLKEAKKKAKDAKMIAKLQEKQTEETTQNESKSIENTTKDNLS